MVNEKLYRNIIDNFSGFCMYYPPSLKEYRKFVDAAVDDHLNDDEDNTLIDVLNIINRLLRINVYTFPKEVRSLINIFEAELSFQPLKDVLNLIEKENNDSESN